MGVYSLNSDEYLIYECVSAFEEPSDLFNNTVLVTNQNIIYIEKNWLGKIKDIRKYPLTDIVSFEGNAKKPLSKLVSKEHKANVVFKNFTKNYHFQNYDELNKFINSLENAIKSSIKKDSANITGLVTKTVKEAVKSAKSVFEKKPEVITKKCPMCGAILTGNEGAVIQCEYCGETTTL